ncbi:MAG: LysR family transcriptional regulator [Pseudomonadota bacterium]
MNITALQTFLTVVDCGNLNKAADRLNVTQSTVTARLDALDNALGQTLLVRSRRGAELTRAGFICRPYAETIVRGWEQSKSAVGLPTGYSGLFSFACAVDLWDSTGRALFGAIRSAHPDLAHEAWPGAPEEIRTWLANGLTDAALTSEPVTGDRLVSRELARERLVQVTAAPPSGPPKDPVHVHVDLGAESRRHTVETRVADRKAGVTYACAAWALDHLMAEGGTAYLPHRLAAPLLATNRLRPVPDSPEFSRRLYLTYRESSQTRFPWLGDDTTWRLPQDSPAVG